MKRLSVLLAALSLAIIVSALWNGTSTEGRAILSQVRAQGSLYSVVPIKNGGTLSGSVKLSGAKPKQETLSVNKNVEHCGTSKNSEALIVGPGGEVKNSVIQVLNIKGGKAFPGAGKLPFVDQRSCTYAPHVQVVPVRSKVELINSDPILHNIHGYGEDNRTIFNVAMPLKNQRIPKTLTTAGIIRLQCDAGHTWMSAYIVVADNPYYAVTDDQGAFSITELPPGSYQVRAWHEKLGKRVHSVKIDTGAAIQLNVDYAQ